MHPQATSSAAGEAAPRDRSHNLAASAESLDVFAGDRSFVMSFARGMAVIQAFANVSRGLSIAEISLRTDIPRAAVRRLLHTLSELGYAHSVGARYALKPKALELGHAFMSSNSGAGGAQAVVARLAESLGTFCAVSLMEGDDTMLLCMAGSTHMDVARRLMPYAGSKSPLYAGASGLVFLSEYSDAQLNAYFDRVAMRPLTFRTPTVPEQLRQALPLVRYRGYAVSDRTFAEQLRSVAMPVRDASGRITAAVLVVQHSERLTEPVLHETVLPQLRFAVTKIGACWAD